MNDRDPRLFEREFKVEIEIRRIDSYENRRWPCQKMLFHAPPDKHDLKVMPKHLDIAANCQFFHGKQCVDTCSNHARPRDTGEYQIGAACLKRLDQMRAEQVAGSLARNQSDDRRSNHTALANNAAAWHSQKINQRLDLGAHA